MNDKKIGLLIKKARIKSNLTQQELGEKIGVTWEMISRYENGRSNPMKNLQRISKILEKPIVYFFGAEEKSFEIKMKRLKSLIDKKRVKSQITNTVSIPIIKFKNNKNLKRFLGKSKSSFIFDKKYLKTEKGLNAIEYNKRKFIVIFSDILKPKKGDSILKVKNNKIILSSFKKSSEEYLGVLISSIQVY